MNHAVSRGWSCCWKRGRVAFAAFALTAQAFGQQVDLSKLTRVTPLAERLGEESLLGESLARQQRPVRRLAVGDLTAKRVKLGDVSEITLQEVSASLGKHTAGLRDAVKKLDRASLFGAPRSDEEVVELDDAFVLVHATGIVVEEPRRVAAGVPDFAAFLGRGGAPLTEEKLRPESRRGFEDFVKKELPALPEGHPLARAAKRGRAELLKAIGEGQGGFEVVDTFVVPKAPLPVVNGRLMRPRADGGVFSFRRLEPFGDFLPDRSESQPPPEPPVEKPFEIKLGKAGFRTTFLTGFTKGSSRRGSCWHWERRWNFPSGFARITLGASYGIGLRVPIRVTGDVGPAMVVVKDPADRPFDLVASIRAEPVNGNAEFYRSTHLPDSQVFDGNEAVVRFEFLYGYRFRALWTNLLYKHWTTIGFNYDRDFTPPFADPGAKVHLPIPPELTHTRFDAGVVSGYAQAGIALSGDSSLSLTASADIQGRSLPAKKLTFTDNRAREARFTLPALRVPEGRDAVTADYHLRLKDPVYKLDVSATPEVRVAVTLGVDDFSRTISTGWMSLDALRIHLGRLTLGHHDHTRAEYVVNAGKKTFARMHSDTPLRDTPVPAASLRPGRRVHLRSVVNHRWVRAGVGEDSKLAATSDAARGWETFELHELGADRVALRSVQSGRIVRGGISAETLLGAISGAAGLWETFEMLPQSGNLVAFRCAANAKYVRAGITDECLLAAVSDRIGRWELFELSPVAERRTSPKSTPSETRRPPPRASSPATKTPPLPTKPPGTMPIKPGATVKPAATE
ncbi:MAG: hypothetical protein HZA91_12150 [Verrucomicrobia bacterium]|nr:hypothetical protein [Verrucomicrobiota bacterium]